MISQQITIINNLGLHARAAAKFVTIASRYKCQVTLHKDMMEVNGKSIMSVMMLVASKGTQLIIRAAGEDEVEAIQQLKVLIDDKFGEEN